MRMPIPQVRAIIFSQKYVTQQAIKELTNTIDLSEQYVTQQVTKELSNTIDLSKQ